MAAIDMATGALALACAAAVALDGHDLLQPSAGTVLPAGAAAFALTELLQRTCSSPALAVICCVAEDALLCIAMSSTVLQIGEAQVQPLLPGCLLPASGCCCGSAAAADMLARRCNWCNHHPVQDSKPCTTSTALLHGAR